MLAQWIRSKMILSLLFLLLWVLSAPAKDDCAKAKELYDQAKNLMNYGERRDAFLEAVQLCPSYAAAHVNLADAYENLGEFEQAESHYHRAIKLDPKLAIPFMGLGETYLKTGRFGLAQEAFLGGLKLAPDDDRLKDGLGVVSERLKREQAFLSSEQIRECLVADEAFQLMCMCPTDHYAFLRKWICVPAVRFPSGSVALTSESRRQLNETGLALKAKELTDRKWLIIGHADPLGKPERNAQLSLDRAKVVKQYLVQNFGLSPASLDVKYFGQNRPRSTNETLQGRAENRRVEIVMQE